MKMYNGIVLPALPEYNKSVYTHGFIQYGGVAGMEIYSLIVSTASGVMGDSYTVGEHTYSAWVVAANETAAENLSGAYPGISTKEWLQFEDGKTVTASTYDNIVWSDFDILKADGSVYLKASKPFDLESFKTGLALGLCGKALPWKAEPVAWLYNGVRLPKLPEWDKVAYPYATISEFTSNYHVRFFSTPRVVKLGGHLEQIVGTVHLIASYQDGAWGEIRSVVEDGEGAVPAIVWANFDVYYAETTYPESYAGTLYLSASDPVPVYE